MIEATETFERERAILAGLDHPRLPHLYETFQDAEHWYLIIDYFPGVSLAAFLATPQAARSMAATVLERAWMEEVLRCGLGLCDILHYLHSRQPPIIFRDLKPGNIIRSSAGDYALIDFGIARTVKTGQLKDTMPLGSPGYAAPEQYGRAQTGAQADIYSLGAILHQMLSGVDPSEQPLHFPALSYTDPALKRLEALILRMVALKVELRPASIEKVARELYAIQQDYELPGERIWVPGAGQTPPWLIRAEGDGTGASVPFQGIPPYPQPLPQPRVSRKRRDFLLKGIGLGIIGGLAGTALLAGVLSHTSNGILSPPGQIPSGNQSAVLPTMNVLQAAWSPDGVYVMATVVKDGSSGSPMSTLHIWLSRTSQPIVTNDVQVGKQSFAWSPADTRYAVAQHDAVKIWRIENDISTREQSIPYGRTVQTTSAVLWSSDGRHLAFTVGTEVRIWDLQASQQVVSYRSHTTETTDPTIGVLLSWSPDGTTLASSLNVPWKNGALHIWHAVTGVLIDRIEANGINWLQWSPNSVYLGYGLTGDFMSFYGVLGKSAPRTPFVYSQQLDPGFPLVGWSPDGTRMAWASTTYTDSSASQHGDVTLQITDFAAQQVLRNWSIPGEELGDLAGIDWSPDGKYIVVYYRAHNLQPVGPYNFLFYEAASGKLSVNATYPGILWLLRFFPDKHLVAEIGEGVNGQMTTYNFSYD
jgi:serine/threonine protein kinase